MSLRAEVDHAHGGRWTSLRAGEREWLWHRPEPARPHAAPGSEFVDAGGLEECVPTVRGTPDHGDVWSRGWDPAGDGWWMVETPDFTFHRRIDHRDGAVVADYRLDAEPGYRFVWAAHALLDVSPAARLIAPDGTPTLVADPQPVSGAWPAPLGTRLDTLGPDDGTAVGAVLRGCRRVRVADGADLLDLGVDRTEQPVAVALWRNLRGWPPTSPYRSIGVEPMLGGTFDRAAAGSAVVPARGTVRWRLTITAFQEGTPRPCSTH